MKRIPLVPDWRDSWRWFSMQAQAIAISIIAGWSLLPTAWQQMVPGWLIFGMIYVVLILGMIGRLVQQAPPAKPEPAPPAEQP